MSSGIDIYLVYRIIRALVTPFDETEAYALGLIDDKGKSLKKASSPEEKKAMTYFDKMIFNMKRLLAKAGLSSRVATFAAALALLRENHESEESMLKALEEEMNKMESDSFKKFNELCEEIANVSMLPCLQPIDQYR